MSIEERIRSTLNAAGQHINPSTSPMTSSDGTRSSSRSWLRRRLPVWPRTPVFASVLLVVALSTAFATFAGLLPWDVKLWLVDAGCRGSSSSDEMVASAHSDEGRIAEMWITRPGPGEPPNGLIVLDFDSAGNRLGGSYGCSPPGPEDADEDVWAGVGGEVSIEKALLTVLGRVSPDAAVARVTLSDQSVVDIQVETDGYFIELITRPGADPSSDDPNAGLLDAIHLAALDSNGQVIEEKDLPSFIPEVPDR